MKRRELDYDTKLFLKELKFPAVIVRRIAGFAHYLQHIPLFFQKEKPYHLVFLSA